MAIFTRRDIQAAIRRVTGSLSRQQLQNLIDRLNGAPGTSLAAEWEIIVLSGFCECGRLAHEYDHGGKTRPDVFFQFAQSGTLEFVADIRAISDKDPHEKNPYDEFAGAI